MADPLVTPAVVGFAVSALLTKVMKNADSAYRCRDVCKELVDRLVKIRPIVTKLEQSASKTKNAECIEWLAHFNDILVRAEAVTNDCLQESRFDKTKRVLKFWRWKKLPSLLTKINTQIDKATADTSLFTLDVVGLSNDVKLVNARKSLGFENQPTPSLIVGVEEHFNKLKTSILQSYEREYEPSTFGLQGRGGAGKTLIAQMLNNDQEIKERYGEDSIIWITVGLEASIGRLYERLGKSNILDSSVSERLKVSNMEDQRVILINAFAEKKVLLILDDVWEKEHDHHDMMYWLDVAKAPGSTTLITTRIETILRKARAEVKVVLSLNNDDSWKLFCSHAFVNEAASLTTIPEEVARAICEECDGLPLALKVIGSAMMDKTTILEWESALFDLQQSTPILDSNVDDELFGRLQLSYKGLKNDATRICFLYFAAFPEDHKIEVKDLINIWVGEELFGSNLNTKEAEKKAYDHLRILVKRSLIDWDQEEKCAHIHDILRDLALIIIDNAKLGQCAHECLFHSGKVSLSLPRRERVGLKRMSFMNCDVSYWLEDVQIACPEVKVCILQNITNKENGVSLDFFNDMTNLKVLDLSQNSFVSQRQLVNIANFEHLAKLRLSGCYSLKALPESIGNLKYLTELNLSDCGSLTALPESIGNLRCLRKLNLSDCGSLMALPESIGNVMYLTKLNLSGCGSLTALPESIGNVKYLTKLNLSRCGSLTALPEIFGNLRCLTKLNLSKCGSLTALPESISNLKCLTELDLSWCGSLTALPESIGNLKCLTELNLSDCGSLTALPKTIGNVKCLMKLNLSRCGSLTALPESISNLKCLTELDLSWCGSLTALPKSIGNLKCLTELNLSGCESLTALPKSIGNLKCLTELKIQNLISSTMTSLGVQQSSTRVKHGSSDYLQDFQGHADGSLGGRFNAELMEIQIVFSSLESMASVTGLGLKLDPNQLVLVTLSACNSSKVVMTRLEKEECEKMTSSGGGFYMIHFDMDINKDQDHIMNRPQTSPPSSSGSDSTVASAMEFEEYTAVDKIEEDPSMYVACRVHTFAKLILLLTCAETHDAPLLEVKEFLLVWDWKDVKMALREYEEERKNIANYNHELVNKRSGGDEGGNDSRDFHGASNLPSNNKGKAKCNQSGASYGGGSGMGGGGGDGDEDDDFDRGHQRLLSSSSNSQEEKSYSIEVRPGYGCYEERENNTSWPYKSIHVFATPVITISFRNCFNRDSKEVHAKLEVNFDLANDSDPCASDLEKNRFAWYHDSFEFSIQCIDDGAAELKVGSGRVHNLEPVKSMVSNMTTRNSKSSQKAFSTELNTSALLPVQNKTKVSYTRSGPSSSLALGETRENLNRETAQGFLAREKFEGGSKPRIGCAFKHAKSKDIESYIYEAYGRLPDMERYLDEDMCSSQAQVIEGAFRPLAENKHYYAYSFNCYRRIAGFFWAEITDDRSGIQKLMRKLLRKANGASVVNIKHCKKVTCEQRFDVALYINHGMKHIHKLAVECPNGIPPLRGGDKHRRVLAADRLIDNNVRAEVNLPRKTGQNQLDLN